MTTKTERKIEALLIGTGKAISDGAWLSYGWCQPFGRSRYGWARYSAAGECCYLGKSVGEIETWATEERAEIARQTHGVTYADLANL